MWLVADFNMAAILVPHARTSGCSRTLHTVIIFTVLSMMSTVTAVNTDTTVTNKGLLDPVDTAPVAWLALLQEEIATASTPQPLATSSTAQHTVPPSAVTPSPTQLWPMPLDAPSTPSMPSTSGRPELNGSRPHFASLSLTACQKVPPPATDRQPTDQSVHSAAQQLAHDAAQQLDDAAQQLALSAADT